MKTIVVADDDPVSRELIREVLEGQGYRMVEAIDGALALSTVRMMNPDLVLLDIRMPVLDGFGVLEALRQEDRFREIPIFALTAFAMHGDRERALAAGFDDYITKPIRISALRERINLVLAPD